MQDRIHLGLDLKGGTHLILQVQVNDAVNVDSDNAVERLKEDLRTRKINYTDITKPDPVNHPDQIVLKGVPPESTSDLRSIVSDRLPEYDLTSGADNTWTLSMKPQALAELKNRAVTQAIETIRNRIDQLGVSEPIIQEHGLGPVSDSGAAARRGRSGAGEGDHAVHRHAGDPAGAGRPISQRAGRSAAA